MDNNIEDIVNEYNELQKVDFQENYGEYEKLISRLSEINLDEAIKVWIEVITTREEYLQNYKISKIFLLNVKEKIYNEIKKKSSSIEEGYREFLNLLKNNPIIMKCLYAIYSEPEERWILICFKYGEIELGKEIFELIYKNKNNSRSNDQIIISILRLIPVVYRRETTWNETIGIFEQWINRIESINVKNKAELLLKDFKNKISNQEEKTNIIVDSKAEDKFEEIKKYKELLDLNIITQEEFDTKKKELLNL